MTAADLGALIRCAHVQIVAKLQLRLPKVEPGLLASVLWDWGAALAADGGSGEGGQTDWLASCRTIRDIQKTHQELRAAILAELPADVGLCAHAVERFGQLFDESIALATERLVRGSLAEPGEVRGLGPGADPAAPSTPPAHDPAAVERANFANLFRHTPEMLCILSGPEHRFELVNEAHIRALGFDATHMSVRDAQPESVQMHHVLDEVYRTGQTAELRATPLLVTDRLRFFNLTYAARRDAKGAIDGIMGLAAEKTDLVLLHRSNQLQQRALELALEDAPLEQVLAVLAQMVESQSRSDLRASILIVDDQGQHLLHGAAPSLPAAFSASIHGIAIGPAAGSCGTAAYLRSRVIVQDIEHDARWTRYKDLALAHGLRACWSVPILTAQGLLLGTFALYSQIPRAPTTRENEVVDLAVRTTALIIGRRREIRERLENAAALREREAELTFTLASAKLGTWSIDFTRGGFVSMSAEAAAMLGLRSDSSDATAIIAECIHPEDREHASATLKRAIDSGAIYHDSYRVRWPSGETRWLEVRGRARYGAAGELKMFFGVLMDITEQKRAVEDLRSSKRMLELAASSGRVGFWHVDVARGTFDPDEKMAADWGIDLATFARTFDAGLAIVHPADRAIITTGMEAALAGREVYDKEYRIVLPSGEQRWIHAQGEFHADETGQRTRFSGVSIDITDRKLAQQRSAESLSKEREKFEQVLEQSVVCIALIEGPQHIFSFANSAYLRTFALDKSIVGKTIGEVFPEASAQGLVEFLDAVYLTGKTFEGRESLFEYVTRNGEIRTQYFDFTYAAKRDSAQRIDGVLATIINVSDRVALRQSSENASTLLSAERFNLNQIIQNSPAAMATWIGPNLIFERVNPEYAKIFPGRQLVGRELLEACPELRGQGFDELLRQVLWTGEPVTGAQVPVQIATSPGGPLEERYFDFTYLRINAPDGSPYCVYDFALDVTDRVLAQRRADETSAKLREAEDLLSRAIEVANIGFFHWDMTNNVIVFSAQMQRDWGIEANTTLEEIVSYVHPDDRGRVNQAIAKAVEEGSKYHEEYRVQRPTDGQTIWIEAQGGLASDRQEKQRWFIGTSLDITQRKHTEEQLRATSVEAHNASSAKSAFLANMSHKGRSPIFRRWLWPESSRGTDCGSIHGRFISYFAGPLAPLPASSRAAN